MHHYLFIIGKSPDLSLFELECVFSPEEIEDATNQVIRIKTEKKLDADFIDRLGGTMKIAEVIEGDTVSYLKDIFQDATKKSLFGISVYGTGEGKLKRLLIDTKKALKKEGLSTRFINKNFTNITSVQAVKENIVKTKADISIYFDRSGNEFHAVTIGIQDFESYSKRDYDKPFRDARMGMLPPKLAQIMLSCAKPKDIVYDPFCGSGTILMEAALQGFTPTGSDLDIKAVHGTDENLAWLHKNADIPPFESTLFQHNAAQSVDVNLFPKGKRVCVVTEGYLGPPQNTFPPEGAQRRIFEEIDVVYEGFFKSMATIMKSGDRIAITFPFFNDKEPALFPTQDKYTKAGFTIISPAKPLLYVRKQQIVGRELVVYEKK